MLVITLDTNVCISALEFARQGSVPTQALKKAISEGIIATCSEIEEELSRILMDKFCWEHREVQSTLARLLGRSVRVELRHSVKVCRDPKEDMFLECCSLAKADLLLSGDKDLLALGVFEGTQIITPARYLLGEFEI